MASQLDFKLPSPEEEAEFSRCDDLDLVRRAQACTGALLWLATRTRPELSVGVAAMSRLCTKAPELAVSIGLKMMAYLKRPTWGIIYADNPGPVHGARQQLNKPRCVRTVEAYSDISYAACLHKGLSFSPRPSLLLCRGSGDVDHQQAAFPYTVNSGERAC